MKMLTEGTEINFGKYEGKIFSKQIFDSDRNYFYFLENKKIVSIDKSLKPIDTVILSKSDTFHKGKYKQRLVEHVLCQDPEYIVYVSENGIFNFKKGIVWSAKEIIKLKE